MIPLISHIYIWHFSWRQTNIFSLYWPCPSTLQFRVSEWWLYALPASKVILGATTHTLHTIQFGDEDGKKYTHTQIHKPRGLSAYIAPLNFMQGWQLRPSSPREFQRNPLNIIGAVAIWIKLGWKFGQKIKKYKFQKSEKKMWRLTQRISVPSCKGIHWKL